MKKFLLCILAAAAPLLCSMKASATRFDDHFDGETLRLDLILAGDSRSQGVYLQNICRTGEWAGRRTHLDSLLVKGNAQVEVYSKEGELIYVQGFSTLFQEWLTTEEATLRSRAFECPVLIPAPREVVKVRINLNDHHRRSAATTEFELDPADILIRKMAGGGLPCRDLRIGGPLESNYDIVIVAEGYTAEEQEKFFGDAARLTDFLFTHAPFNENEGRFNVRAVFAPSPQSGTSQPSEAEIGWRQTAAASHFDTFYSYRYLTTSSLRAVHDIIGMVPFEQIILLVNTTRYGGGGIYNNITLSTADHPFSPVVFVHEFGHSFAGLADEYAYGEEADPTYPDGTEPWEPNITTLVDFGSKWQDMLPEGIAIPTELSSLEKNYDLRRIWDTLSDKQKEEINSKLGVYEGAGYRTSGVYRPVQDCRMRINECEHFCPVCKRAIRNMIDYCTGR